MEGKTYIPLAALFVKTVILPRVGVVIEDADINAFVNVVLIFSASFFRYLTGKRLLREKMKNKS